jgi:hypothetical protein
MERMRQAASTAELRAFVLTRLGSQTNCVTKIERERQVSRETRQLGNPRPRHRQDRERGRRSVLETNLLHVILHPLRVDVNTRPNVAHGVPHAELVEHVRRIEPGVVADLAGDDLERLGEGADDELLLAFDRSGVVAEVGGDLHLVKRGNGGRGRMGEKRQGGEAERFLEEGHEEAERFKGGGRERRERDVRWEKMNWVRRGRDSGGV